jgi:hypothetical protein
VVAVGAAREVVARGADGERDHRGGDQRGGDGDAATRGGVLGEVGQHPRTIAARAGLCSPNMARDPRRWIYGGLDLGFAAVYAVVIWWGIPSRAPAPTLHLACFPAAAAAMATGMFAGGPRGWWLAAIAASLSLAATIALIGRLLISAAFLAGVYGAFGEAAAAGALVIVALVIELVGLLPVVQLRYLRSAAGRRALGR